MKYSPGGNPNSRYCPRSSDSRAMIVGPAAMPLFLTARTLALDMDRPISLKICPPIIADLTSEKDTSALGFPEYKVALGFEGTELASAVRGVTWPSRRAFSSYFWNG